jgi:hypothetical protein
MTIAARNTEIEFAPRKLGDMARIQSSTPLTFEESRQTPPFKHGALLHSSISISQSRPANPGLQEQ